MTKVVYTSPPQSGGEIMTDRLKNSGEEDTLGRNSLLFAEISNRTYLSEFRKALENVGLRYKNEGNKPLVPGSVTEIVRVLERPLGLRATLDAVVGLQTVPGKADKRQSWAEDYYSGKRDITILARSIRDFLKDLDVAQNKPGTRITLARAIEFQENITKLFDEISGENSADLSTSQKRS